ncbi:MAG: GntR family transcriptional regulator [Paenibacillus macerans]|uniref:UTRA domain protein n=1 Tax=Paenibacillus macerans TaxID=44252 RepID=A0A090Z5S6_PAEMA|nr:GntR family transcriptional regulator [Paenibacillus macerans]KFN05718.1 UTRA domain protein [Paenibacillus macerans]MBS5909994.1 GntR family transcriptional regulator [Paenibacillus macerans]MCY7557990.1 GntR family transcriptional regulator [Paenibacillus macerans]MDU5946548.1 GntR family transcriptional regulator [Paenibacillus macerans]MDU7472773.1 GntR family transcriptional regulator [Paenibacillus macerans]
MGNSASFELEKNSPIPLYFQLKEDMIKKINNEEYKVNESLPSETQLMTMYGVSRTTVRQAIDLLVNEGYLEKRRGVGTFVAKPNLNQWDLAELRSFNEIAGLQGLAARTELLSMQRVKANETIKSVFGEGHSSYYKLERLRFIENEPSVLVTTYVPVDVAPDLERFNFSEVSLFATLREHYGLKINYANKTFRAINASPEDAAILKVEPNFAIQLVETVTYDDKDRPFEYSVSRDRGDLNRFRVLLRYKD